jgi:hypothetical protein
MLVLTKDTLLNPGVLKTRNMPRRFFRRVSVWPRGAGPGIWARLIFEGQFLRYIIALTPFVAIMFLWRDAALPVAHAPLPMVALIIFVEMRVLRVSDKLRKALVSEDEAARRLDTLNFRARALLREIAARKGLEEGDLHLVVEQSELARVAPLTFVTVQSATPTPHVLDLDARERAMLHARLFDTDLSESALHEVNQSQKTFLRSIRQEVRAVSAHARLAAWIDKDHAEGGAGAAAPQGADA